MNENRATEVPEAFEIILSRAAEGDEAALEAIYSRYSPMVLGYLRANGAAEPEDLAGEVFIGMVKGLRRFRGGEPEFRSWLMNITHRRLLDERRRRDRRPAPVPLEALKERYVATNDSAIAALDRLHALGVLEVVETLTPDQREVLLLHVIADLPLVEVARVTGRPLTATKALWRRATQTVARRLRQNGIPASTEEDEVVPLRKRLFTRA
ncbi:MAG: hypothetical protein KatS3mg008_0949 [Acidimicrobiales bacterium]|nr:MAG: hypothetical protein KatS3mg008_0949 [Acidimicrobiales bacterium]